MTKGVALKIIKAGVNMYHFMDLDMEVLSEKESPFDPETYNDFRVNGRNKDDTSVLANSLMAELRGASPSVLCDPTIHFSQRIFLLCAAGIRRPCREGCSEKERSQQQESRTR